MDWKYLNLAKYAVLAGKSKLILTHIETQNKWHLTIHIELTTGSQSIKKSGLIQVNWHAWVLQIPTGTTCRSYLKKSLKSGLAGLIP